MNVSPAITRQNIFEKLFDMCCNAEQSFISKFKVSTDALDSVTFQYILPMESLLPITNKKKIFTINDYLDFLHFPHKEDKFDDRPYRHSVTH